MELSPAYNKALKGSTAFKLFLYACNSATTIDDITSISERISKKHKNSTIIGFEGFVFYGTENGKPSIVDISSKEKTNDNKVYIVTFKNGKIIKRELYSNYVKN